MGTSVRCPRCKHENLAIDIWCARCGTPVDWRGTPTVADGAGNGHRSQAKAKGRPGGLAALAAGLPWLKANQPNAAPAPAPIATGPAVPSPAPAAVVESARPESTSQGRAFCPGCGMANEASNQFCPRCGQPIAAAHAGGATPAAIANAGSSRRPTPGRIAIRMPRVALPRIRMPRAPRMRLPRFVVPPVRLPRIPVVAWAIAAVILVLLLAPLAYVLSPSARRLVAGEPHVRPAATVARTAPPAGGPASAVGAAVPGVEAKTGLKYTTGACPSNKPCLKLAGQTVGLNAAAIVFSTAATGGRQCVGYVDQAGGAWHFLDATCGLPGQVSPLTGSQATVHVPGQCANVRDAASLQGSIVACLNDGTSVRVDGGPNYADGKLWWHLEKNGWMAHEFLKNA